MSPEKDIPPRVRPIAALLTKAWQTIDLDNEYFWDMVKRGCDALSESGKIESAGLVVAKSGRNAAQFGKVSLANGEVSVIHGIFTPSEVKELVNGANLSTPDGSPIQFDEEGSLAVPSLPNAVVLRNRPDGAASLFGDPPLFLE
jgi:hypothetical protein